MAGIFIEKASDNSACELIRTASLEAATQLAFHERRSQLRLLDYLLGVHVDQESTSFLSHAVKIMGFAFTKWREESLIIKIKQVTEIQDSPAEAAFEYAMVFLVTGIESVILEDCICNFENARSWFEKASSMTELFPQADIYAISLSILCELYKKENAENFPSLIEEMKSSIFEYQEWHHRETRL